MKIILLGNAGSGKSTLAKRLLDRQPAAWLSLDRVAFREGAERRPLAESVAEVRRFIDAHGQWIIEGCYADIIEPILPACEELIFLNPGVEACVAHCRSRPWEPEKFATREAQDAHLEALIAWVRAYETRDDEHGLRRHRALFDGFPGRKMELDDPSQYASMLGME
ncbi:shikimate kinase [Bisbaumannia pacifica]|uniref:Shikimate kinase n=1 Tax=Bisbaumannia pacifica TaxID=77098 RepID=A0ABD4L695_9GAMM|nr:shikimate kinase [Halomonas pacifica]MBH8581652.1 shikimate kinase [Halomonas pacifica]